MQILFFGDGEWATRALSLLATDGWSIPAVVLRTRPTDPALAELAYKLGAQTLQPRRVNSAAFLETVRQIGPDLNLSVSYDQILQRPILNTAPRGFINVHAGALPLYRGRNVINWVLINGENEIGVTVHYVDEGIDTGDIILQRMLPIAWTDTYADVLRSVVAAIPPLIAEAARRIADDRVKRTPQSQLLGTYFASRGPGDEWLDWHDTSLNLYNKIRAITRPGPGARTLIDDRVVIVWRATYDRNWPRYLATPGQVVGRRPDQGVQVKTGDSTLLLEEIQFVGENPVEPTWRIGTRLGVNLLDYIHRLETRIHDLERQ